MISQLDDIKDQQLQKEKNHGTRPIRKYRGVCDLLVMTDSIGHYIFYC